MSLVWIIALAVTRCLAVLFRDPDALFVADHDCLEIAMAVAVSRIARLWDIQGLALEAPRRVDTTALTVSFSRFVNDAVARSGTLLLEFPGAIAVADAKSVVVSTLR